MIIQNEQEKNNYRLATEISTEIVKLLAEKLEVGVLPADIEKYCWELCEKYKVKPAFDGVRMNNSTFTASCNINVNDEILHSIPSSVRALERGDVVKIDFGAIYKGFYTDQCYCFILEEASDEDKKLVNVAKLAIETGVSRAFVGNTTGDIGYTIDNIAYLAGFDVLKNYVGHGIGKSLHEEPSIPAYGEPGKGVKLKEGMVVCIEAQIVSGSDATFITDDDWTVKTSDGKKAAMFEYMVIVGKRKPEILTKMQNWSTIIKK